MAAGGIGRSPLPRLAETCRPRHQKLAAIRPSHPEATGKPFGILDAVHGRDRFPMAWGFWRWSQGRLDQAPSAAARQPASVRLQLADCVRIPGSSVDGVAITHQRTLTQPWEHSGCFEAGFGPLGLTALAIKPVAAPAPAGRCGCGRGSPSHRQPARSSPSSQGPPPGPALLDAMAAVAEGIATTALAAAHPQGGWLIQPQLIGHPPATEVGAIAEPTVAAAAAAAELMHPGRQIQRLRARGGGCGLRHQRRCCCGWNPKGDLVGKGERINHPVDGPMRAVAESLLRPGEPAHTSRQGGAMPGEACWQRASLTPHPAEPGRWAGLSQGHGRRDERLLQKLRGGPLRRLLKNPASVALPAVAIPNADGDWSQCRSWGHHAGIRPIFQHTPWEFAEKIGRCRIPSGSGQRKSSLGPGSVRCLRAPVLR